MPCLAAQSQLDVVNMINYVVDEIKYKIPDILCKHKNLALSSPAMKSLMTCQGWCVLVADRKKLLPGEVDLYCGRQRGARGIPQQRPVAASNAPAGGRRRCDHCRAFDHRFGTSPRTMKTSIRLRLCAVI